MQDLAYVENGGVRLGGDGIEKENMVIINIVNMKS